MGTDPTAEHNSSTIVTLYDPTETEVRADVRLGDVPLVARGQPVQIETAWSPLGRRPVHLSRQPYVRERCGPPGQASVHTQPRHKLVAPRPYKTSVTPGMGTGYAPSGPGSTGGSASQA
jgi:hypothetical protein